MNIKIVFLVHYIFMFSLLFSQAQESSLNYVPEIAVSFPYIINKSTGTFFYNEHFLFELFSVTGNDDFNFSIIDIEQDIEEGKYQEKCKVQVLKTNSDYLLYSSVYSIEDNVFLDVKLLNPYKNQILFSHIFSSKVDFTMNENIADIAEEIVREIKTLNLPRVVQKKLDSTEENPVDLSQDNTTFFNYLDHYKHELFIMNGFFKNNPEVMSFLTWHIGYNFIPLEYLYISTAFVLGTGTLDEHFNPGSSDSHNNFFIGGNAGLFIFIKGIIEPNAGLRVELLYTPNKNILQLSLPLDIGLKIYVTNKDVIRISTSLPITNYDITNGKWGSKFTLGLLIGYGRKI